MCSSMVGKVKPYLKLKESSNQPLCAGLVLVLILVEYQGFKFDVESYIVTREQE